MAKAKIKVLFVETHYTQEKGKDPQTHGVDYARVVNPAKALMNHPDFEVEVRKNPAGEGMQKDWDEITQHFDVIYSSYIDSDWGYAQMAMYCEKNGIPHIMDVDDNLWEVPRHSPVHKSYHIGSKALHIVSCALENTPYVTTTNKFLKYRMAKYLNKDLERIKVLPNYIDLSLYKAENVTDKTSKDKIQITFYGTSTHTRDMMSEDFSTGLERVMEEFPNVMFHTTGFFLPQLVTKFGGRYKFGWGERDFTKWIAYWEDLMSKTDIVVAPLERTDFNRCKSGIKYLEYSAAGKAGVYQDIRQYQELIGRELDYSKRSGLLAGTANEWYEALKKLVVDETLRKQIGANALKNVQENHTIQGQIENYADYIKWVVNDHREFRALKDAGFVLSGQIPN